MSDEERQTEGQDLWRATLETVGEGKLADRESLTIVEAMRVEKKLTASLAEIPQHYAFDYSPRDVDRLTDMSRQNWLDVQKEWRDWHRRVEAFGPIGVVAWLAAAVSSYSAFFRAPTVVGALEPWIGPSPAVLWRVIGGGVGILVLMNLPRMIGTILVSQYWDSYSAGYGEGLRAGVNRALKITPEAERGLWDAVNEASVARSMLQDVRSLRDTQADPRGEPHDRG